MSIATTPRADIIKDSQRSDTDSGSPEVQISLLTQRIQHLTDHVRTHKHDYSSRRGLLMLVGRRNRLLRYLARVDRAAYQTLIKKLGLRK